MRVNARFDEELARLKVLWAQQAVVVQPPPAAAGRPASAGVKAATKR